MTATPTAPSDRVRSLAPAVAALAAYALLNLLWMWLGGGPERWRLVVTDLANVPLPLGVALLAWLTSRTPEMAPGVRWAWRWFTVASAAVVVADLIWFYYEVVLQVSPLATWADPFFFLFYIGLFAGLLCVPRGSAASSGLTFWLDTGVVMTAAGLLSWVFLIEPLAERGDASLAGVAVLVATVICDLLVLFGLLRLVMRGDHGLPRLVLDLIAVNVLLQLVGDIVYARDELGGGHTAGGLPEVVWGLAWVALAAAAEVQRRAIGARSAGRPEPADEGQWRRVTYGVLPYAAVLAVLGALVAATSADPRADDAAELALGAALITLLVSVRQVVTIREGRRLVEALEQEKARAEAGVRVKEAFLANISHEVRTPIGVIVGLAERLAKLILPAPAGEQLRLLRGAAAGLLRLVDDILDFSRLEAGKLHVESIAFAPADLLTDVRSALAERAEQNGLTIEVMTSDDLPRVVHGDPLRLRQVLLNLLDNALKFTPSGWVRLEARLLTAEVRRVKLLFSVEDSGIGIATPQQQEIFAPFSQGDASASRRFGGTGLGLAICDRLVRLMGGRIELASSVGSGARFSFALPFELQGAKVAAAVTDGQGPTWPGKRVLLAEDEPVSRMLTELRLRELGCEVDCVEDGHGVLAALDERQYDLLLLDCQMPDLDGYATARLVREQEAVTAALTSVRLPIVAVTAHALEGDRERCLDAGMDDYLAKPFSEEQLEATLGRWLAAAPEPAA